MISIIYPKDKKFRIFTWELLRINTQYGYFGCLQMKSKRELKFFPLIDYRPFMDSPVDSVCTPDKWYGAFYYNILKKSKWARSYYFLFGLDQNNIFSNKKVIDVLYFKNNKPYFGAPFFIFNDTSKNNINRFIIEYKFDASTTLNYSKDQRMILYDHLIPMDPKQEGMFEFYVPDGSYEGFKYKRGKWLHVEKVFDQTFDEPSVGRSEQ